MALILQQVARSGYTWHHYQTAPTAKLISGLTKLHDKHRILLDQQARTLRRKSGFPVAYLVLTPWPEKERWPMVLLATKKLKGERMAKVKEKPLIWPGWNGVEWVPMYILHFDPETEQWTWRLTEKRYEGYLGEALFYAHEGNWPKLNALLAHLNNLPNFRGILEQKEEILGRVQKVWGDKYLRTSKGHWREPPWRKVVERWPKHPTPIAIRVWDDPPRTVGSYLEDTRKKS